MGRNDLKNLWKHNQGTILVMAIFVFLVHGSKINSSIIGIDTEDIIRLQDGFYPGWLQAGRHGLVFLKKLLGTDWYHPFFAPMVALLILLVAVAFFFLLWDQAVGWKKGPYRVLAWILGSFLWLSHPVLTEQLYFTLQSLEICAGFALLAVALFCSWRWVQYRKWMELIISLLILILLFSCYQVFVVLYIFGVIALLLLEEQQAYSLMDQEGSNQKSRVWLCIRTIFTYAGIFLFAFAVNLILTKVLFGQESSYLIDQIQWRTVSLSESILRILDHGWKAFTGRGSIYYHASFGILCIASIILTILLLKPRFQQRKAECLLPFLLLFALISTPFWMTFVCGCAPVMRSQLVLPILTGFLAYDCVALTEQLRCSHRKKIEKTLQDNSECRKIKNPKKIAAMIIILLCVPGIWSQTQVTMRLYYTETCRYEQDTALGRAIMQEVASLAGTDRCAIVFVGSHAFTPNNACLVGETMGHSFFDYDTQVEPDCYWSSRRVIGFLHTLGYQASHASTEDTELAVSISNAMPVWPNEGSVCLLRDFVVVKLSD